MIPSIIKFIEGLIILIIPIYLIYQLIHYMFHYLDDQNIWGHYKHLFCMAISFFIFVSLIFMMGISWMQIGIVAKDVEMDETTKRFMFFIVTFIWQAIGLALIYLLWKNVANKQLIPGTGGVKLRLKKQWWILKRRIKDVRRKKDTSNNDS